MQQSRYNYPSGSSIQQPQQQHVQSAIPFYASSSMSSLIDEEDRGELNNVTIQKGSADFRRRKNWSERILIELTGLLHVLSPTGKILYCSESILELTGYRPHELVGQALMDFLHVDDMDVFIRDFQMSFHTRSQIKTYYRFRKKDDTYIMFEVVGQPKTEVPGQTSQAFFGIAQPVPTKGGALIDSFLELKSENNWLRQRIDELSAKHGKVSIPGEEKQSQQIESKETNTTHMATTMKDRFIHSNHHKSVTDHDSNDLRKNVGNRTEWLDATEMKDMMYNAKDTLLSEETAERKDKWKRRVSGVGLMNTIYSNTVFYYRKRAEALMNTFVRIVVRHHHQSGERALRDQKRKIIESNFFLQVY